MIVNLFNIEINNLFKILILINWSRLWLFNYIYSTEIKINDYVLLLLYDYKLLYLLYYLYYYDNIIIL